MNPRNKRKQLIIHNSTNDNKTNTISIIYNNGTIILEHWFIDTGTDEEFTKKLIIDNEIEREMYKTILKANKIINEWD